MPENVGNSIVSEESGGEDLILSPALPVTLKGWAELYGVSEKTISRYQRAGKLADPPDPPPLACPLDMEPWYLRHHQQAPPADFLLSIIRVSEKLPPGAYRKPTYNGPTLSLPSDAPSPAAPSPAATSETPPQLPPPPPLTFAPDADSPQVDYQNSLHFLQLNLQHVHQIYCDVQARCTHPDPKERLPLSEFWAVDTRYREALAAFQKAEKEKSKILKDAGETIAIDHALSVIREILSPLPRRLTHAIMEALDQPDVQFQCDQAALRTHVRRLLDRAFESLQESRLDTIARQILGPATA